MYNNLPKDVILYEILEFFILDAKKKEDCRHFRSITITSDILNTSLEYFYMYGINTISSLPDNLKCNHLVICGDNTISSIPDNLKCDHLNIGGKNTIPTIPDNLICNHLVKMAIILSR